MVSSITSCKTFTKDLWSIKFSNSAWNQGWWTWAGAEICEILQILWKVFSWTWSKGWILNKIQRKLVKPNFIPQLDEFPIALSMKIGPLSSNAGLQSLGCWCRTSEVITNHISWTLKMILSNGKLIMWLLGSLHVPLVIGSWKTCLFLRQIAHFELCFKM